MLNNLKNNIDKISLVKILFYIYPIVMLRPSGYITVYVTFLTIYSFYFLYKNKIKILEEKARTNPTMIEKQNGFLLKLELVMG